MPHRPEPAEQPGVSQSSWLCGRGARGVQGLWQGGRAVQWSLERDVLNERASSERTVDLIVFPPQALGDPDPPPFWFR